MMDEYQAYPKMPHYSARKNQWFSVGDCVEVGPKYTMDGYELDGCEGVYFVHDPRPNGDYGLKRDFENDEADLYVYKTRLQIIKRV